IAAIVYAGFVQCPPLVPILAVFVGFMLASSFRNVAYNTLTTRVPRTEERARFSSIQSAVQHLASALGAFASSLVLVELPDKTLAGIPTVAWVSIGLGLLLPPLLWTVEARVRATVTT